MAKPPRKPRPVARSADLPVARVTGPRFRPHDGRQPDLFRPAPAFIPPCKPILRDQVPIGQAWRYEIKWDGYRIQAHAVGEVATLYSKSGRDYTDRMPSIIRAMLGLGRDLVLDGEAVMLGPDGAPAFYALHAAVAAGHAPAAQLVAFDLLALDGRDLRPLALGERQALLAEAVAGSAVLLSEIHEEDGRALFEAACRMGLEGIVAKRRDRPYRSGERDEWVKVKCRTSDHFAVIGFDPRGRRGVASLRIARLVDGKLQPCGSVGSGIGEAASRALRAALDAGEPVVVEVDHGGVTPAGELRAAVYRGLATEDDG